MVRRSLSLLSLAALATALSGFTSGSCGGPIDPDDPPVAVDAGTPVRECAGLGESACLARSDCRARYGVLDCTGPDCGESVFVRCEVAACPPVLCDLACPDGFARDESGCEICSCSGGGCRSDADCRPGEACVFTALRCLDAPSEPAPLGSCVPLTPGCSSDADCAAGERCVFPQIDCPPDAYCAPPRGSCRPEAGCVSDADCGLGRYCQPMASCTALGCPPPTSICLERPACDSADDCAPGTTCAMDPNDPCRQNACLMYLPVQLYCIPGCEGLGEADCLARTECEPMYGARCGNDPDTHYLGCKPAACLPVVCDLYCPNGNKLDARGCPMCACNEGCSSDADCAAGERCEAPVPVCPPGVACPQPPGACVPAHCTDDAQCRPGERCYFTGVVCMGTGCPPPQGTCGPSAGCRTDADCAAGERCSVDPAIGCGPDGSCAGVCQPARCQSDADCRPGESCIFLMAEIACLPGDACGWGTCNAIPSGCASDADCAAGERCEAPVPVCPPGTVCPQPLGACVPARCQSDADCRPGESCIFLMAEIACLPGDACGWGTCNAVPSGCASDADCPANEQCLLTDCAAELGVDCSPYGHCAPRPACAGELDCAFPDSCQPDPTDPCSQPNVRCLQPGRTICLPTPECASDAECAAGQTCRPDPRDPCNAPNACCFQPGRSICQL